MKETEQLIKKANQNLSRMKDKSDPEYYKPQYIFNESELHFLLESFAKERMKYAYPDTEADGYVFCGKCGNLVC